MATNTLDQVLLRNEAGAPPIMLDEAEKALVQSKWSEAVALWRAAPAEDLTSQEKLGYALMMADQFEDARSALSPLRGQLGSGGMTALAVALVDNNFHQGFNSDPRPPEVNELLKAAISVPKPVPLAYWMADFAGAIPHVDFLPAMRHALERFPNWEWPRRRLAQRDHDAAADVRIGYLEPLISEKASSGYLADAVGALNRSDRQREAIRWLMVLLERERAAEPANPQRVALIEMQIALANLAMGEPDTALELCEAYVSGEKSLAGFEENDFSGLLRVAATISHARSAALAIQAMHDTWVASPYSTSISSLIPTPIGDLSFSDNTSASWPYSSELTGLSTLVVDLAPEAIRGLFRVAFAEYCRNYGSMPDEVFAEEVQVGYEETPDARSLTLLAISNVRQAEPDWGEAGRIYAKAQVLYRDRVIGTYGDDPFLEREAFTDAELTAYAAGMAEGLREAGATSHARDIFNDDGNGLRDELIERKLYHSFQTVATAVLAADPTNPDAQFDAAIGAHWCNQPAEAKAGYLKVLAREPAHYSARFNLLLLCNTTADLQLVEAVESSLVSHPVSDADNKEKLTAEVNKARSRCSSPKARKRQAIDDDLAQFKGLQQELPAASRLSLRDAVTLVTLFEACRHRAGTLNLEPFDGNPIPFSPTRELRGGIFSLLRKGIIQIGKNTPDDAFDVENGAVTRYKLGEMHWEVSPATLDLLQAVRDLAARRRWLKKWCEDAPVLARELAIAECIQYIWHCCNVRSFDHPDDPERLAAYAGRMVDEVAVTQAFNLIYGAAKSAADYQAKYPVNTQQVGNYVVINGIRRLDSWTEKRWELKGYERTREVTRSAFARVLHDQFLRTGEKGFTQRIADLDYPQPKQTFSDAPPSPTVH